MLRHTSRLGKWQGRVAMRRFGVIVLAVAGFGAAAALAQEVDIAKAVDCQALAQQFGDSVKAAKADDAAKKSATELAGQGDKACNAHDYDAGIGQIRQALQQVGLKPTR
jgi:uncharacterized protein YdbL (DUF1318 family)